MPTQDVAIFWDYENCSPPSNMNGYEVVKRLRAVAHNFGTIKLFKAYLEISDPVTFAKSLAIRSELQASGVSLTDCPHNGRKDVADKMILVDMLAYAIDNPAPAATIILISGDRDFAYAVSILRLRRYRVVVVSLPNIHESLKTQASVFLEWTHNVAGVSDTDPPTSSRARSHTFDEGRSCQSKKPPSHPPLHRIESDDAEVDIMEHLQITDGTASWRAGDIRKFALPERAASHRTASRNSNSSDGSTGTLGLPSRAESAPAAIYVEELTPAPKTTNQTGATSVIHSAVNPPQGKILTLQVTHTALPLPERRQNIPVQAVSIPQPFTAPNSDLQPPMASRPEVPKLSPKQQLLQNEATNPPNVLSTSAIVPIESPVTALPQIVSPLFKPLVERLEYYRSQGFPRPLRSAFAIELVRKDHAVYRRAGVGRFGAYVALAEKASIVQLGGTDGGAWIALRPEWYGAVST